MFVVFYLYDTIHYKITSLLGVTLFGIVNKTYAM